MRRRRDLPLLFAGVTGLACAQATVDPTVDASVFGRGGPADEASDPGPAPATDPFFTRPDDGGAPEAIQRPSNSPPTQVAANGVCREGAPADDPKLELMDDFEDGDRRVLPNGGRNGSWSAPHDDTPGGTQTPEPFAMTEIAGCANKRYAQIAGKGFRDWGAQLSVNFTSGKAPYDASKYAGITFWARSATGTKVRVNFPNKDTDKAGGLCETMPGMGTTVGCHNHWGAEITLSKTWTRHTVLFSGIKQEPYWGRLTGSFDAASVYSVMFAIPKNVTYDVWVDDLAMVLK